jgi:hypothetical protein
MRKSTGWCGVLLAGALAAPATGDAAAQAPVAQAPVGGQVPESSPPPANAQPFTPLLPKWNRWNNGVVPSRNAPPAPPKSLVLPAPPRQPVIAPALGGPEPVRDNVHADWRPTSNPAPLRQVEARQPSAAPTGPYETRGLVLLEELAPPAAPAVAYPRAPLTLPARTADPLAEKLAQGIRLACPAARNVRVTIVGDHEIRVDADVRSTEEANAFADQIFVLDALRPYRVKLHMSFPEM